MASKSLAGICLSSPRKKADRETELIIAVTALRAAESMAPSDSEIRKILAQRVDDYRQSVGIVAGVIEPGHESVVAYGKLNQGDPRPLNGDTIFEIGSITKVFTSLLLADMVERGEVALNDPVAKYLPQGVHVPERGGRSITLLDLATHTSGLPSAPTNFKPKDPSNPYADYSEKQLYEFLSSYTLTRDIGSKYQYSNIGGGLLGLALARRGGTDYETLVKSRICAPLDMNSTTITLSPEMKSRRAPGHNAALNQVSNWDLPTLAGAGALRSTANDLLKFLAANLTLTQSPLAPAMAAMLKVRRPTGNPDLEVALGWHSRTSPNADEIVWHNGGTGGYRSFIGFDGRRQVGVVVLSNTSTPSGGDDIGMHLLDEHSPLLPAPKQHQEITINPKILDAYVGRYQFAPNVILTVTGEGSRLFVQLTGQPRIEIFAESVHDFFCKVVDAQITFETDDQGRAIAAILHQAGRDQRVSRVE